MTRDPSSYLSRVVYFISALAFALVPLSRAQQTTPQTPPIRVATHLVQIGVTVRDNNGPVGELTKDDFAVFDRGKPRTISVFTAETAGAATQSPISQPLPPNTFSDLPQKNVPAIRSVTIVLLDNLNTLSGNGHPGYESGPLWMEDLALANAKAHLIEFIGTLDLRDRVAIYGLSDTLHVLCDFTSERERLIGILRNYDTTSRTNRNLVEPGKSHTPVPGEFNPLVDAGALQLMAITNERRAEDTMAALHAIASHVANIPGRKNLVWLTANLPFSGATLASVLAPAQIAAYPVDGRGLLARKPPENDDERGDEQAAYLFGDSMPAQSTEPIGIASMQVLADETGGRAFVNTNDLTGSIRKAVEDSEVIYTLGFYVDSDSLDGRFHAVKVRVRRSGLNLHYPNGYFALKDEPTTKDERRNNFLVAIKSPLDSANIPIEIRLDRLNPPTPNSFSLSGAIGVRDVHFAPANKLHVAALDITVLEQDQAGKILHESTSRLNLRFTEAKYSAVLKSGINFREFVPSQAGATTVRILVQDSATAIIGSVIVPLSEVK